MVFLWVFLLFSMFTRGHQPELLWIHRYVAAGSGAPSPSIGAVDPSPSYEKPLSETRMSEKARNIPRNGHIDKLYIIYIYLYIYTITYIYISDIVDIGPKWINS